MLPVKTVSINPILSTSSSDAPGFSTDTWCQVTILKETSGVVMMGISQNQFPISSSNGMQLPVDMPVTMLLAPGSQLYFVAQSAGERVSMLVQDLNELIGMFRSLTDSISSLPDALRTTRTPTPTVRDPMRNKY